MSSERPPRLPVGSYGRYFLVAVLTAAAIGIGGARFYKARRTEARRHAQSELTAIADMKAGQISSWLREQRGDAEVILRNPQTALFLSSPAGPTVREDVVRWMAALQETYDYRLVALFDSTGAVRETVPAGVLERYVCAGEHVREALTAGKILVTDLHRAGPDGAIHMSLLVPIGASAEAGRPARGVLLLVIDPYRFLFPLVQTWPLPSPTAETLLVERDGGEVVYLNELRHRAGTALTLRRSLNPGTKLPSALAVQGHEGVLEGIDYRGVPVLAATRRIPETPWFMVAKVDRNEIIAPIRGEAWIVGLIASLLFLTMMLSFGLIWRHQNLAILRHELAASWRSVETAKANGASKTKELEASEKSRRMLLSLAEDQKAAEDALRMNEAQLSNALRMARAGRWEYDVGRDTFTFNDNFYRIFRTSAAEVGGYTMSSAEYARRFCHSDDAAQVGAEARAAIESADPGYSRDLQHRILFADGSVGHMAVRIGVVKDGRGRTIKTYGVNQDITERVKAEEAKVRFESRLQQQQKLESIGILASGVAHEINNPVNGILNYAQLIADRIEPENPIREYASEIMKESDRISGIVRNLLSFSRHEKQSHSPADLQDIVNATLSLTRTVIRHDQIRVEVEIEDGLPKVKCRSQQIQQVIMNLLTNARDALNEKFPGYDDGKVIRLKVHRFEKDGKAWIRTSVENGGSPIPPETRAHLFEPFFSTKPRDKGTGLGLSISYGIVKDHHGELYLDSGPGEPTRFHMDLPVNNGWGLGA